MSEGRCVILVVDDDEAMAAYVEELLAGYGYEHVAFSEAEKALEYLAWNVDKVDLIISDIVMPGINGYELARQAAGLKPDISVILLSAFSETLPGGAGISNVKAVLEKPLVRTDLIQAVEAVLRACRC